MKTVFWYTDRRAPGTVSLDLLFLLAGFQLTCSTNLGRVSRARSGAVRLGRLQGSVHCHARSVSKAKGGRRATWLDTYRCSRNNTNFQVSFPW